MTKAPSKVGEVRQELRVQSGNVLLAGQLWVTASQPRAAVLMVPGSGPSDRHNDVFFPPIREHLLANDVAVASFDKRGVGGSTGDWLTAGIVEQADDTIAALEMLKGSGALADVPIGLFGHSQGGWVVLDAAARGSGLAFVVTSSGPGVSPGEQERHAAADGLRRMGLPPAEMESALTDYEAMLDAIRSGAGYQEFQRTIDGDAARQAFDRLRQVAFVPDGAAVWNFAGLIIDYDPRPAMRRIGCPVLALFGAEDRSVPVEHSVRVYRDTVSEVAIEVFAGADHRCQVGDPPTMAPGYLDALTQAVRGNARPAAEADCHQSTSRR